MKHFECSDIGFKYWLRSVDFAVLASQYVKRAGVIGVAFVASATVMGQGIGVVNSADPLAPGYVYRASRMLAEGNPLGAADQTTASIDDFEFLSPQEQADWLAAEGGSLFERGDAACVEVLTRLATEYPSSDKSTQALLTLGDWYWYHKDWHEAIDRYARVDISRLASGQKNLYSYRKALAYLKCGLPESAAPLLASIAKDPEYARASKYYTAYIHYLEKDYDSAYEEFSTVAESSVSSLESSEGEEPSVSSLQSSETKGGRRSRGAKNTAAARPNLARRQAEYVSDGIEPLYYMAQIEYLRGQYDDVIDHASTIMVKNPVEELLPELHRIMGLSYFKKNDFIDARPHLEEFVASSESPNDDALYALGAVLYADGDLTEAEKHLRGLTDRHNAIAQGAYLYLGQIAEQRGDMNAAAMAFSQAANMAFDQSVAETAAYNHIVALTKGGNAPFASNIAMLESFIDRYPDSRYASDVQESLAAAYFYENDFHRALNSINKVRHPSQATLASKQKILYKLGMSEITTGAFSEAATHLREAADMKSTDRTLADESRLWLGEALYGSGDYKGAAAAYAAALRGDLTSDNKTTARYGLAYSQFKQQDWSNAEKNFANVAESGSAPAAMKGDALVRDADCLLYLGDYQKAAAKFLRASREGAGDADYAAFRHAVVTGLTEGTDSKMKRLNAFLKERPGSKWTSEVLLEAGKTMAALDQPDKAAPYFERLKSEYPKDNKSRAGALSLALAYIKQGETEKAKEVYMDVIRNWPTSEEASIANDDMRRITASDGTLIEYSRFLATVDGAPKIDPDEMDAITFEAAETAYADDPANTGRLERYIADFPDGRYLANALMDLAEAADSEGDHAKTLIYLERLLSKRGDSPQVPAALFLKADLLEASGDNDKALAAYLALEQRGGAEFAPEAIAGVMRTTADARQRTEYARRLLSLGGASAEDAEEARFYEASGMLHGERSKAGEDALKTLAASPNSLSGAKAAVELGEWYLEKGDTKNALSILEKFTDAGSVHSYWLARGFISLADAYHADGNDYLAVEYLKSLRDNYPGDETDIAEGIAARIREYSK
ncbi:MAG: tetratricopeptide repeat protein [Muribaculaceae bacterium]|nr:tetratricopeptide repeat protein [Muribaculaceae bacterium]